ncbi:MAG: GNAT family N-acetyltransferase [Chloroflexota bacterium]
MSETTENPTRDSTVTLREITEETVLSILRLKVAENQKNFVAPNAVSIAQAHFSKHAWFRAIYADETPIGFLMIHDEPDGENGPVYYLWRFMVDERYQRMGFGRQAISLLLDHMRTRPNATAFYLSYVPEEGGPRDFYASLGFEDTGEKHGDELEMRINL